MIKGRFDRFRDEWFLLLSPAYLAVRGFVHFSQSVHWSDALSLFWAYALASVVGALVFAFFLGFRKAALFVSALVFFNDAYSVWYEWGERHGPGFWPTRFAVVVPAVVTATVMLFICLRKTVRRFNRLTSFLNVLFLLLIGVETGRLALNESRRAAAVVPTTPCPSCPKPDVYLIITDGYAGAKQLREQFHFNNGAFEDSLRRIGFYVVPDTRSNYSVTNHSMASLLTMRYLPPNLPDDLHAPMNPAAVTRFFGAAGYRVVNNSVFRLGDDFPLQPLSVFKTGKILLTYHSFSAQTIYVMHNLLAGVGFGPEKARLSRLRKEGNRAEAMRDSATMQRLLRSVREGGGHPQFVYTHFLMPHGPHLFDSTGRLQTDDGPEDPKYISYHVYTNRHLLFAVKSVLALSKTPPIILLLSDHGSRIPDAKGKTDLRFYNLAAVYRPDKDYSDYYKGMSNVNQFRVLLNKSFGQRLPLLPDSTVN